MAGVAGLEPVTSAVTGQRSNQLSYTPAMGDADIKRLQICRQVLVGKVLRNLTFEGAEYKIRAADAKEVGVGNPAEETCCYPNKVMLQTGKLLSIKRFVSGSFTRFQPISRLYPQGFFLKVDFDDAGNHPAVPQFDSG